MAEKAPQVKTVIKGLVNPEIKIPGKTVLITGANTGMGLETAIDMARRGARVIMTSRDPKRGEDAKNKVVTETNSDNVILKLLDLSSMESVRQLAKDINENEERLDILINNAGVMMCPQSETKEGYELQFGVNHLGHFLLTNLLLDLLKKSAPSRIVHVSSTAHYKMYGAEMHWDDLNMKKIYTPMSAYCQSKLMNVLFSRELTKRLEGTGVNSYCLEPGAVKTDLQRHVGTHSSMKDRFLNFAFKLTKPFWKTAMQGAQTQIYCAVAPELANESGKYYADCKHKNESTDAKNDDFAKRLWDISEDYTGLKEKQEEKEEQKEEGTKQEDVASCEEQAKDE